MPLQVSTFILYWYFGWRATRCYDRIETVKTQDYLHFIWRDHQELLKDILEKDAKDSKPKV